MNKEELKNKGIHARMALIKSELAKKKIEKSGKNTFANFKYHELQDFLKHIVELNNEHGVNDVFDISTEKATLTLYNNDNAEDKFTVSIPYVMAQMTGKTDDIQRLGSTITYIRRYLYLTAYGIQENDAVDASEPTKERPQVKKHVTKDENKQRMEKMKVYVKQQVGEGNYGDAIKKMVKAVGKEKVEDVEFNEANRTRMTKALESFKKTQEEELDV